MIERHDRAPLAHRALRRGARGLAERAGACALPDGFAFLAEQDRPGGAWIDADQAIDHEREHLVEVEGRGEDVRDLEQRRYFTQFAVGFALETALLDDSGDLVRDRLQEVDLLAAEVARLHGLHVHHPDDLVARDNRDREHRHEALLVDLGNPLPAWLGPHIARCERNARVRDPADDAFSQTEGRAPDATAIQPVRRDKPQQPVGTFEEIQR